MQFGWGLGANNIIQACSMSSSQDLCDSLIDDNVTRN